jgi:hypothetical protein
MVSIKKFHSAGCPKDATCDCPWRLDYRPLGVRGPCKRIEFPTKKQAERYLIETKHKVSRGTYVDPVKVPTLKEAAERWFAGKTDRRPSHVRDLRIRLDKHILPRLGSERLDRITVAMIEAMGNDLRAQDYAPRTVRAIVSIVKEVFKAAIRRGETAANPTDQIERSFTAAHELKEGARRSARRDGRIKPRGDKAAA